TLAPTARWCGTARSCFPESLNSRWCETALDGKSPLWPIRRFPRLADVGLVVVLTAAPALAQSAPTGTIRGTVVDTHDGTPLRRVSVRLQATGQTTVTDDEGRSEEHTSELQSRFDLVCRLLLEKKKNTIIHEYQDTVR